MTPQRQKLLLLVKAWIRVVEREELPSSTLFPFVEERL